MSPFMHCIDKPPTRLELVKRIRSDEIQKKEDVVQNLIIMSIGEWVSNDSLIVTDFANEILKKINLTTGEVSNIYKADNPNGGLFCATLIGRGECALSEMKFAILEGEPDSDDVWTFFVSLIVPNLKVPQFL